MMLDLKIQLNLIQTKLVLLVWLYVDAQNLQNKYHSNRDTWVMSKNQNKMAVTYYNVDFTTMISTRHWPVV